MKTCNSCAVSKSVDEFYAHPQTADRLQGCCKDCHRSATFMRRYGITLEQYNEMLDAQGGACAICGETKERSLHVDHDHVSGTVRGLLCDFCNIGLGHFQDDPDRLVAAAAYIIRSQITMDVL